MSGEMRRSWRFSGHLPALNMTHSEWTRPLRRASNLEMRFRKSESRFMPGLNRVVERPSRWTFLFVAASLLSPCVYGQATPPQKAPAQAATSGQITPGDPRRPEIQPSLSVDRDPVPSPDAETPEPTATATIAAPTTTSKGSDLQKGKDGIYTLHENVD